MIAEWTHSGPVSYYGVNSSPFQVLGIVTLTGGVWQATCFGPLRNVGCADLLYTGLRADLLFPRATDGREVAQRLVEAAVKS